jgi:RES domain-containing protein
MASRRDRAPRIYRIVSRRYPAFDGGGAYHWGSRWVSPGSLVVHASETYALAVLENVAHWQASALPKELVCVEAVVPASVTQSRLDPATVPGWDWPDYIASRQVGDRWYEAGETAVLWVPSVVSPYERNALVNQRHADFAWITVRAPTRAHIDPRFVSR